MRKRNNPIPLEYQRTRHIGFADEEQEALPKVGNWDRNCDGETYEDLDLRHINFSDASLVGASFINCDLRGCYFYDSNISNTNFKGSDLRDFIFLTGVLSNVNFESCNLSGAQFVGYGDYLSCNWNNTSIEGTNFRHKDFFLFFLEHRKNPNPSIYMHGTPTFKLAHLQGADLRGAALQGAALQGANLQGADLQGANLQGANLQGANLHFADLQGANLNGANLQDAKYSRFTTVGLTVAQKSVMIYINL